MKTIHASFMLYPLYFAPLLSRILMLSLFTSKILANLSDFITFKANDVFLTSCVHNRTNRWFVLLCRVCCQLPHVYPYRMLPQSGWLKTGIQITWDAIRSRNCTSGTSRRISSFMPFYPIVAFRMQHYSF